MSQPALTTDVTVVGAGILGLSTAFELLRRDLSVTVVGRRDAAHAGQASRAAGAMLTVFSEVEAGHPRERAGIEVAQRVAARYLYDTWLTDLSAAAAVPLSLIPGVWVVANGFGADDPAQLSAICEAAHSHGFPAEYGAAADVPGLRPQHRAFEALWLPDEASVDPVAVMAALETAVARHPRCVWVEKDAHAVTECGEHLVVAAGAQEVLGAHLVLAAGAQSARLLTGGLAERAAIPPVWSGRGVSVVVDAPFALPSAVRTPNRGFACGSHLVPRPDGSVYLGATNRLSTEPDYQRGPGLDEIATLIHDGAAELHADLRKATLRAARVGHRPVTIDHLPLLGSTGHPLIHLASATYRCGVLLAPLAANLVADGITAPGSHADHPYRPTRPMPRPVLADQLRESAPGLVDMLCQPGGVLPAGTDTQLAGVLRVALTEIAGSDGVGGSAMRRLWERAPMAEAVPLILEAVGRL